jgi:hypothetical protein
MPFPHSPGHHGVLGLTPVTIDGVQIAVAHAWDEVCVCGGGGAHEGQQLQQHSGQVSSWAVNVC